MTRSTRQRASSLNSPVLWLFVAVFVLLGLGYSILTPVFENSDETLHYPYVKHLADGKGLPLAKPGQPWNQEGTQPPLYYALAAAATFWLNTDNLPDLLQRNPHWLFTEVRALINDNQNLALHGPMDAWPYARAALAVHIGRWVSLLFGLLTVAFTFWLARDLFPRNLPLVVTATALTALTPQFLRVSATVSNDSLSAALTSLTILLAFKFTGPPPARRFNNFFPPLILGLVAGLALLTKLSSLSTLALVAFIVFWRRYFLAEIHESPGKQLVQWWVIIGLTVAALTGWWFFRNYRLYGEWFATDIHLNLAGRANISLAYAWSLRAEAERAYWATFGWGQIRPPEWVYQIFFWLTRIGLLGLALGAGVKLVQGEKQRPLPLHVRDLNLANLPILLLWAAANLALYLRWVMEVGSVSHTRLVFPAITAISILLALGWHILLPRRLEAAFSIAVTVSLLALNLYSLGWLIGPAFNPAPPAQVERGPWTAQEITYLNSLKLVDSRVYVQNRPDADPQTGATTGDVVMVAAKWQVLAQMDKNYSLSIVLLAPNGDVLAHRETYPGLGLRPTRYLTPGQTFTDVYPLRLDASVAAPVVARAVIAVFDVESDDRAGFPARNAAGQEITPVVGQVKITPTRWPEYRPGRPVQVSFADAIRLTGYDLTPPTAAEAGRITLYWQSQARVTQDYNLFIHLLDAQGRVIAQADAPPTNNAYPTGWWSPGEQIADPHTLPPASGVASLRIGLYNLTTGQRLAVTESTLPVQDNGVEIKITKGAK